jgi:catechol 2,3-dioxygenase-like lactoylglutathione lyase family enzyme
MLKAQPIIAFVATTDPRRAKAFYAKTLGLRFVSEDPFAVVFDAAGTMLRLAIVPRLQPAGYTVLGWIVPDIRREVRGLVRRGVVFSRFDGFGQDQDGIWASAELYDPVTGTFSPTGSMGTPREFQTSTRLADGRVLIAGGYTGASPSAGTGITLASYRLVESAASVLKTAELYDPATGTFSPTGSMAAPRQQHTATLLADGRVLIAGGLSGPSPATAGRVTLAGYRTAEVDAFLTSAELYDPATGRFSKTGSMSTPHRGHTATLLQDGRVLVVGNGGETSPSSRAADVYDPATGRFSKTGSMKTGRWLHTATLLQDGRVLITGGRSPKDSVYISAEIYDPRSGTFGSAGSMREGRQQQTATLLADGRVLIAGGLWSDGHNSRDLSSTEMYDPRIDHFSSIGSMGAPRDGHSATLLADGRVLILGGEVVGGAGGVGVASAVIYQP